MTTTSPACRAPAPPTVIIKGKNPTVVLGVVIGGLNATISRQSSSCDGPLVPFNGSPVTLSLLDGFQLAVSEIRAGQS